MELLEVQKEADSAGRKAVFFGICALVLAGLFGWMLARLSGATTGDTQSVVVAAEVVPPLTPLKAKHLKVVAWPVTSLPTGYFAKIDDVLKSAQLNVSSLVTGEPLLASRLSTPDRGLGVAQLVDPTMRAFVVQVNDSMAKAQIIHPDESVDVIATLTDPRTRELVTKVILQNIKVLAVGDSVDVVAAGNGEKPSQGSTDASIERHKIVTLLVSLNDVEHLAYATREGKIDLALRSNLDSDIIKTNGVNAESLLGHGKPGTAAVMLGPALAPQAAAPAPTPTADVRPLKKPHATRPEASHGFSIYKVPNRH